MKLHPAFVALAMVTSVLLPLILLPVPTLAQIQPLTQRGPARQAESRSCTDCGVVASVNLIKVKGEGRYPDTLGDNVVVALLGSQGGNGRALEEKSRTSNHFEVVLRMQSGTTQTVTYATEPGFKAGDKVQIHEGVLTHQP
jgi:hypothetical protein